MNVVSYLHSCLEWAYIRIDIFVTDISDEDDFSEMGWALLFEQSMFDVILGANANPVPPTLFPNI